MSRTDLPDFDHPPGLASTRNRGGSGDRDQRSGYHHGGFSTSFLPSDRRPSFVTPGYSEYAGSIPRSLESHERRYGFEIADMAGGPNRHNLNATNSHNLQPSFSSFNHHPTRRPSSPPISHNASTALYNTPSYNDRDVNLHRITHNTFTPNPPPPPATLHSSRSTLWWGEIEPWMDEEYAKQVCGLMGWDPVNIKVPHPVPDPATGQQANNPGYCFLTFPTPAHAASVLAQINNGGPGAPVTMPNSSKPFVLNWASSVQPITPTPASLPSSAWTTAQQYPKEYSIFVGDLAPETSNSDLVAVFRNPVLGLRNDREPKFIRPFLSCKSAKIMLDPVTGVSRGYGFVRWVTHSSIVGIVI